MDTTRADLVKIGDATLKGTAAASVGTGAALTLTSMGLTGLGFIARVEPETLSNIYSVAELAAAVATLGTVGAAIDDAYKSNNPSLRDFGEASLPALGIMQFVTTTGSLLALGTGMAGTLASPRLGSTLFWGTEAAAGITGLVLLGIVLDARLARGF